MNSNHDDIAKEYIEIKEKINKLQKRRNLLKKSLFEIFDSTNTDEIYSDDIKIYRVNHPKILWDENSLKPILLRKGLWGEVLSLDPKKVKKLLEDGLISEEEIEETKVTKDIWYTLTKKVKNSKLPNIPSSNQSPRSSLITSKQGKIGSKILTITDLSRMKNDRVCIFGFDQNFNPIRPVLINGIRKHHLFDENNRLFIKPFAEIKFNFIRNQANPPHTEDYILDSDFRPRFIRNLSPKESEEFLVNTLEHSVDDIFGGRIYENRYIKMGEGKRSLGTIKADNIRFINYSQKENGGYNYRIRFTDSVGNEYYIPITDYAFMNYCDKLRIDHGLDPKLIGLQLQQKMNNTNVYLRVGLSRSFRNLHWLLISGLHTFPDYKKH